MSRQYDLFRQAVEHVQEVRDRAVTGEIMRDCYQFGKGGTIVARRCFPIEAGLKSPDRREPNGTE